jgi:hypothetical protein
VCGDKNKKIPQKIIKYRHVGRHKTLVRHITKRISLFYSIPRLFSVFFFFFIGNWACRDRPLYQTSCESWIGKMVPKTPFSPSKKIGKKKITRGWKRLGKSRSFPFFHNNNNNNPPPTHFFF